MVEAALAALGDTDAVMVRVGKGAEEGDRLAEAVGLGEVQDVAEEGDRLTMARRGPHDVAEALNPGDARGERLGRRAVRQPVELHGRAGVGFDHARRAGETAVGAFVGVQRLMAHAVGVEPPMQDLELALVLEHPPATLEAGPVGLMQDDGVRLVRALEAAFAAGTSARGLQPDDLTIERGRPLEIGHHQLDIAEFLVADHDKA